LVFGLSKTGVNIGLESEVKENEKKSLFFMAYGNSWGTIGCLDVLQPNL
jgi:hypothetical protein